MRLPSSTSLPCSAGQRLVAMFSIGCAVLLVWALNARAEVPTALPVDGQPFEAALTAVDADWNVALKPPGKVEPRTLPGANLVRWGAPAEVRRGPVVVTAEGGLLVADVLSADPAEATLFADLFGKLTLPVGRLAGVVFELPADRAGRDRLLLRVERAAGGSDRVLLSNDDELSGTIERLSEDKVELRTEAGPLEVDLARIVAVVFNPELRRPAAGSQLRGWVGFSDGSRLLASRLVLDAKTAGLDGLGTQGLETLSEEVVFFQPLGGRAVYLSDLEESAYRHLPYLSTTWPYHRDRSVGGGRLRAGGRVHLKGLGLHSAARLSYELPGDCDQFQCELAIDDSAAGQGSVQLRVYVDRKLEYSSETIRSGDPPEPVRVDTADAARLDLIVDFADKAHVLDHADLLDARLIQHKSDAPRRTNP